LKQYKSNPFEWIVDDFSQTKNIQVIGNSKHRSSKRGGIIENILMKIHYNARQSGYSSWRRKPLVLLYIRCLSSVGVEYHTGTK
jgi:hypothetical protein